MKDLTKFFRILVMIGCISLGFTSCHKDDDGGEKAEVNEPTIDEEVAKRFQPGDTYYATFPSDHPYKVNPERTGTMSYNYIGEDRHSDDFDMYTLFDTLTPSVSIVYESSKGTFSDVDKEMGDLMNVLEKYFFSKDAGIIVTSKDTVTLNGNNAIRLIANTPDETEIYGSYGPNMYIEFYLIGSKGLKMLFSQMTIFPKELYDEKYKGINDIFKSFKTIE